MIEDAERLYAFWYFLTEGKSPAGLILRGWKPIEPEQAMHILYVLQEYLEVFPDTYEMCQGCKTLIDTENEYYVLTDEGFFHEECS